VTRTLCIDIDNVLCATDKVLRQLIASQTNGRVLLDYEDVKRFNYWENLSSTGQSLTREEWVQVHERFALTQLPALEVLDGAVEALTALSRKFCLEVVTSRSRVGEAETQAWLSSNGFPRCPLRFVEHRQKHTAGGPYFAVIEDDLDQAILFARSGVEACLIAHPWNVSPPPGIRRFGGWSEVSTYLLSLQEPA
jgi:uncharacterized HAD superfamily protein